MPETTSPHTRYSLVVPVFRNEGSLPELIQALEGLDESLGGDFEVVFVVDGSPDRSAELLAKQLPKCTFQAKIVLLSRNFGSFSAIRAGLAEAEGPLFAVMAADLQEPPELVLELFAAVEREGVDVAVGTREARDDPSATRVASQTFWWLYQKFIQPEMPRGGVDIFGCTRVVRDHLLSLEESNTSLVGLLYWLGFQREEIPYHRRARQHGRSAWTWSGKLKYLIDSIFSFSDLPIRLLIVSGALGLMVSIACGSVVFISRLAGLIEVPGYATTVLVIVFFAALNTLGLGIIGAYVWRAFENTKRRPGSVVMSISRFASKKLAKEE